MPCMTHVISFYYGKPHINGPKRSVPWCCKSHMWQTSLVKCLQTFAQKKVQYHNTLNDTRYLNLFWEYPTETIKKARYHDAVYDTCYFILFWKIPHKWPKKDRYHDAVHGTCDNTLIVKCLQTFATELDAIMCLMSKTEQFEFRTLKCHIETNTLQKLLCVKASVYESVCVCVKASACKSLCV